MDNDEALVKHVARAMCEADGKDPDEPIRTGKMITTSPSKGVQQREEEVFPGWQSYMADARRFVAAYKALRTRLN